MKLKIVINKELEERVEVYAQSKNQLVKDIESLVNNYDKKIIGYYEDEIVSLNLDDICRFYIELNKTYASTNSKTYIVKYRLYQIEDLIGDTFIKVNQSCLVNINKIKKFSSSLGGYLLVELTNGEKDYISRRQTKIVMERMGINK